MKSVRRLSRRRRRHRRISFAVAIFSLLVSSVAAGALYLSLRPEHLRLAVGPPGSNDVKVAEAIAHAFARNRGPIRLSVVVTESSTSGASLLSEGKADLAIVRNDLLPKEALAVAVWKKNVLVVWAPTRGNTSIKELKDLQGLKIGMLGVEPADPIFLREVLSDSGVTSPEKMAIEQFPHSDTQKFAEDRTLMAFAALGPVDSKTITSAIAAVRRLRGDLNVIAIDRADAIVQRNPRIESAEIPKGAFNSAPPLPAGATSTVQMDELIVASKAMSEQVAARFAEQLLRDRLPLVKEFQGLVSLQKANTEKDASVKIHPGVAAYLDGTERTFLERYGDYFWGALLLGSGLGSIGAWWRGIFHKKEQDDVVEMRRQVLILGSEVDSLKSLDQIGQAENKAEAALRSVLDLYEEGSLDEAALTAFGMVMDQFRYKALARRLTLDTGSSASNRS